MTFGDIIRSLISASFSRLSLVLYRWRLCWSWSLRASDFWYSQAFKFCQMKKILNKKQKKKKKEKTLVAIKQVLINASINILVAENLCDDVFRVILYQCLSNTYVWERCKNCWRIKAFNYFRYELRRRYLILHSCICLLFYNYWNSKFN